MTDGFGVVTFFSSNHAVHAEKTLKNTGWKVEMIPGPKDISPNCGVALRYDYAQNSQMEEDLKKFGLNYEACHFYQATPKKSLLDKLLGR